MDQYLRPGACADGQSCVEVARVAERIGVRNSRHVGDDPILIFDKEAWCAFVFGDPSWVFDLTLAR
jgi:Domain of unknown function (DUF397)